MLKKILPIALSLSLVTLPVWSQSIDFGADSGEWANDGECDDPRFIGAGMTSTELLAEDIKADATDCKKAFSAGLITLNGVTLAKDGAAPKIDFGTDAGEWANDGECDDPRFEGTGMTSTALLVDDMLTDASDCKSAFDAGTISLVGF